MENYEELSLNIRSSFRFLAHYNNRIISLMNFISEKLNISKYSDNSPWYEPIINNKNNLSRRDGGIHWLPMFFHEFKFENKDAQLSIFIQSDSGSWAVSDWNYEIDDFTEIESSKTRIIFAATNSKKCDLIKILFDDENFDNFLKIENIIPLSKNTIVCKSFELKDFKDEAAANNTLKEYIKFIKKTGIIGVEYKE